MNSPRKYTTWFHDLSFFPYLDIRHFRITVYLILPTQIHSRIGNGSVEPVEPQHWLQLHPPHLCLHFGILYLPCQWLLNLLLSSPHLRLQIQHRLNDFDVSLTFAWLASCFGYWRHTSYKLEPKELTYNNPKSQVLSCEQPLPASMIHFFWILAHLIWVRRY